MKVNVLYESGYFQTLYAIGLSYGKTSSESFEDFLANDKLFKEMETVARNLAPKSGGHNSFLELLNVWVEIIAPRNWWAQMDRYRVGKSQLSSSTMHTIQRRKLTINDFESIDPDILERFNNLLKIVTDNFTNTKKLKGKELQLIKNNLPEGFLQKRVVMLNYKSLANIILQRRTHALGYWKYFLENMINQLIYPELLPSIDIKRTENKMKENKTEEYGMRIYNYALSENEIKHLAVHEKPGFWFFLKNSGKSWIFTDLLKRKN